MMESIKYEMMWHLSPAIRFIFILDTRNTHKHTQAPLAWWNIEYAATDLNKIERICRRFDCVVLKREVNREQKEIKKK